MMKCLKKLSRRDLVFRRGYVEHRDPGDDPRGVRGARRSHGGGLLIPKNGLRELVRALKQASPIWYAADQAYDRQGCALVPFFGVPAMTNAALTAIGRISSAPVVPLFTRRRADGTGLYAEFLPAQPDYPSGDPEQDAALMNRMLEEKIRLAPAEYYWIHRRFKNRPAPLPDPYAETV